MTAQEFIRHGRMPRHSAVKTKSVESSVGGAGGRKYVANGFDNAIAMVPCIFLCESQYIEAFCFQVPDSHLFVGIGRPDGHRILGHLDDQFHRWAAEIHHIGPDAKLPLEAQSIGFHSLQAIPDSCLLGAVLQFKQPVQSSIDN
ncbi:MAG: hypothetical protein RLZZ519_2472 [Bacteroidota bacterium]